MAKKFTRRDVEEVLECPNDAIKDLGYKFNLDMKGYYYKDQMIDICKDMLDAKQVKKCYSMLSALCKDIFEIVYYNEEKLVTFNNKEDFIDYLIDEFNIPTINVETIIEVVSQCGGRIINIVEELSKYDCYMDCSLKEYITRVGAFKENLYAEIKCGFYLTASEMLDALREIDYDSVCKPLSDDEWLYADLTDGVYCVLLKDQEDIIKALKYHYNL